MTGKIGRVAVAAAAFASVSLAGVPAAQAQAEGTLCGLTSTTDRTGEPDTQIGAVEGGPLTATSTDPEAPWADPTARMTLICTIQVGPVGAIHAGPDAASESADGTGTVVLLPTSIDYVAHPDQQVYLCTEVMVNHTVYYYDETNAAWSQSSWADCAPANSEEGICFRSYHQGELVVWDTGWECVQVTVGR